MGSNIQIPANSADDLIAEMMSNSKALTSIVFDDPATRVKLMGTARSLMAALETPTEKLFRMILQPFSTAVLGVAIEMNLFTVIAEGGDRGRSAAEVASITGGEELLIVRIMRALTALGIFKETGAQCYGPTPLSLLLVGPEVRDELKLLFGPVTFALGKLPEYLASTGFKNPTDANNGPHQYALNTKLNFFEWLEEDPERNAAFNRGMTRKRVGRIRWYNIYSLDERLVKGLDYKSDAVLLVDVGGGKGHDAQALRAEFPSLRGRLIVQDQPHVIDPEGCEKMGIEAMPYSFFEKQPVIGARAYYMSSILHDWPDEACRDILRNVTAAMKPGYSRLLLNEAVLPSVGAPLPAAMLDICMMIGPCGMERTHTDAEPLLTSFGPVLEQGGNIPYPEVSDVLEGGLDSDLCAKNKTHIIATAGLQVYNVTAQRQIYDLFNRRVAEYPELGTTRSAYSLRSDDLLMYFDATPEPGSGFEDFAKDWARETRDLWNAGQPECLPTTYILYVNNAFGDESLKSMYGYEPWRLERLRSFKAQYDPNNRFAYYNPTTL